MESVVGHIGAIWRTQLKLCTLAPPVEYDWTCASLGPPKPKRQIDRFSGFCTAHGRKSLYLQWASLSPKIAPSHWGSGPPYSSWFHGPAQAHNPNGISIGSAAFAQMAVECPYTLQWDTSFKSFPLKIAPSHGGIWTPI